MYLNPLSVAYESIAEIGILTDLADKDKVKTLLKTKPSMTITPTAIGKYDICGILYAHKFNELSALVQQIDIKPLVKNLDVLIFTDLWDNPWHPENLVISPLEKVEKRSHRQKKTFTPMDLDEKDLDICRALMRGSRTPFKDIANSLGVSTSYVTERYRLLREKNVLNLSSITVNLPKLGYRANADSYIKVTNRGGLPEVEEQLLEIPNLTFCAKYVGGAYDFRVAVNVQDFNGVDSMKQAIYSIDNVKHAEFYIFVNPIFWFSDFIGGNLI